MRFTSITPAVAMALFSSLAVADWATIGEGYSTGNCLTPCNSVVPPVGGDETRRLCDRLAEDGCADSSEALIPGVITFATSGQVPCSEAGPVASDACVAAYAQLLADVPYGGPGGAMAGQASIYNSAGIEVGTIGAGGGCLPIDPFSIGC